MDDSDDGVEDEGVDKRSSAGSSCSKGTPAEKFLAMRMREPTKRLLVFEQTSHQAWGADADDASPVTSDEDNEEESEGSRLVDTNSDRTHPELHDVTERLWDFAQHVDRIEKHKMALQQDREKESPVAQDGVCRSGDPMCQQDLRGDLDSTSQGLKKTSTDVKRLCLDFKKNERGEEDIREIMAQAEMHLSLLEKELLNNQSKIREQNLTGTRSDAPSPAKANRAWGPHRASTDVQTHVATQTPGLNIDGFEQSGRTEAMFHSASATLHTLHLQTASEHLSPDHVRSARAPRDGSMSPDMRARKSPNMRARAWRSRSPSKSPKKPPSSPQTPHSLQLEDLMEEEPNLDPPRKQVSRLVDSPASTHLLSNMSPGLRHAVTAAGSLDELLRLADEVGQQTGRISGRGMQSRRKPPEKIGQTPRAGSCEKTTQGTRARHSQEMLGPTLEKRLLQQRREWERIESQRLQEKQAAETEDRRHVLRQQVSEDGIHESYGMPQMPQQSFQLDPQPAMVFRGKFRSLVTNGTGSKTSQDSINKASAGLHNGAPKHSPTGRYGSPSKHAACKSFSPNKEGAANDTSNVEKWLGVSKWCSDESALLQMASAIAQSEIEQLGNDDTKGNLVVRATSGARVRRGHDASPTKKAHGAAAVKAGFDAAEAHPDERKGENEIRAEDLRKRLTLYYRRYNPTRLSHVDDVVEQFGDREPVLSALLRQKYGASLMRRDRHTDLSEIAMTEKERELKSDLLRDREALRYAEFFCGDRCFTTSDHARVSPYHSSRIQRTKAVDVERGCQDDVIQSRLSSPCVSTTTRQHSSTPNVGDNGQGTGKSGLTTSHLWPLLKLVQADTKSTALEEVGSWSCERVAIFLSQTNAESLSTHVLESMRRKGLNGLGLLNATDSLLLRRYGVRGKQHRNAVLDVSHRLRAHLGIAIL